MSELEAELQLLRTAPFEWVTALAEALEIEGIEHRVISAGERRATNELWSVYVAFTEMERAREVDRYVMLDLFPDLPDDFDPTRQDAGRCPACQEPVVEGAAVCASCGLALLESEG